uniref:Uncharacterized protein n=1 Tax=Ralstonia pickettii (strain 12D) TaxID=428406 RepID=C6BC88_RALP1
MKPRENDPNHPYVRALKGCGHGRLFTEPCIDCEIVGLLDEYKNAVRKVQRTRDRLRAMGVRLPGSTSVTQQQERSDADQA